MISATAPAAPPERLAQPRPSPTAAMSVVAVRRWSALRANVGRSSVPEKASPPWRRFPREMADLRPLVLVLEDLHWADEGLLDFVDELADRIRDAPRLSSAARPELNTLSRCRPQRTTRRSRMAEAIRIEVWPPPRGPCQPRGRRERNRTARAEFRGAAFAWRRRRGSRGRGRARATAPSSPANTMRRMPGSTARWISPRSRGHS